MDAKIKDAVSQIRKYAEPMPGNPLNNVRLANHASALRLAADALELQQGEIERLKKDVLRMWVETSGLRAAFGGVKGPDVDEHREACEIPPFTKGGAIRDGTIKSVAPLTSNPPPSGKLDGGDSPVEIAHRIAFACGVENNYELRTKIRDAIAAERMKPKPSPVVEGTAGKGEEMESVESRAAKIAQRFALIPESRTCTCVRDELNLRDATWRVNAAALRARIAELEGENTTMCAEAAYSATGWGKLQDQHDALRADRDRLAAEVKRSREALEEIAGYTYQRVAAEIAKEALAPARTEGA